MLIAGLSVFLFAGVLIVVLGATGVLRDRRFAAILVGGYVLRLLFTLVVVRDVKFFTHAVGGDSMWYEAEARLIAFIWKRAGIHFVTANEFVELGPTSLPGNVFAVFAYFDDGPALRIGCTALVALAAGLTALNLYLLAVEFGADRRRALLFASILYLQPAFLFYTSDMYKDGLVLCFVMGALGSALRLANRFRLRDVIIGLVSIWALWYVRFYLIFVTVAPLVVGVVGLNAKGFARSLVAALGLALAALVLAGYTDVLQLAAERATNTFELGTSEVVIESNSMGGSGVLFDDGGSPYRALGPKLAYTLFSPFLWAGGSIGFHLGKLDVLLWYYVFYCAVRAVWGGANRRLVIMLGTFIAPCTVMYAMSMSNVGLIVRQRLVIVAATTILAAMYKPRRKQIAARDPAALRALRKLRAA
jgi:hypothetical protein